MAGLYLEQFSVGQTFVHEIRRTVTDMDNILFSALTYNPARVHIDHEYSKSTEFGKPLMNSIFTLGLIIGLTVQDTTLGTTVGNFWVLRRPNSRARCLPAIPCGRRRKLWRFATANRARPRGSSPSSIVDSTSATKRWRIAGAPG